MNKTKVIFRKTLPEWGGETIAIFPALAGDSNPYRTCMSYERVGQHGAITLDFMKFTLLTTPENYTSLKAELESIGYDLQVAKRMTRKDLQARIEQTKTA